MKTSVNTGEVLLPQAQAAGWGVKTGTEHRCGSEKQGFGVEKWLDGPSDRRKITGTAGKTTICTMNIRSNGKSQLNPVLKLFPVNSFSILPKPWRMSRIEKMRRHDFRYDPARFRGWIFESIVPLCRA